MRLIVALVVALLVTTGTAYAKPVDQPSPTTTTTTTQPPVTPTTGAPTPSGEPVGVLGGTDVLQGLGATDSNCSNATGQVAVNCASDGFAASAFSPSLYAPDVNVDGGPLHPVGSGLGILMDIQATIFTVCAYIVAGIVMLLSAAVSFDPFRADQVQISHVLDSALGSFTWPLITLAMLLIAAFAMGHLFKRQIARGFTYVVGAMAAIVVTIAVLSNVGATLGWVDDIANGMSSVITGALSGHSASTGGFAQAEPSIWQATVEEPWCVMEFGSAHWCMSPVSPAMAAARNDVIANHMDHVLGDQDPDGSLTKSEKSNELKRMAAAKTNGELFLSFITNSDVRNGKNDKWTFYSAAKNDPTGGPQLLTIRGPGGFGNRFVILLFGSIAGGFFVATLIYIAWQVATAALWFIMMLIADCVAILMVAFGESGIKKFLECCKSTLLALIIKVLYLGYLGILLALSGLVLVLNLGWFLDWMLLAAVWSLGFFRRKRVLEMLSFGHIKPENNRVATILTAMAARNVMRRRGRGGGGGGGSNGRQSNDYFHAGDTHNHLHVHQNGNGNGHKPERVQNVSGDIEGTAHELGSGE